MIGIMQFGVTSGHVGMRGTRVTGWAAPGSRDAGHPGLAGREWCAVVWERSSAELRGKKVAKGCVGMKWHRVGWRQSAAQVGGSEVVRSSARTE